MTTSGDSVLPCALAAAAVAAKALVASSTGCGGAGGAGGTLGLPNPPFYHATELVPLGSTTHFVVPILPAHLP